MRCLPPFSLNDSLVSSQEILFLHRQILFLHRQILFLHCQILFLHCKKLFLQCKKLEWWKENDRFLPCPRSDLTGFGKPVRSFWLKRKKAGGNPAFLMVNGQLSMVNYQLSTVFPASDNGRSAQQQPDDDDQEEGPGAVGGEGGEGNGRWRKQKARQPMPILEIMTGRA